MAAFRKRGNTWVAEVCVKGIRQAKTFRTKTEARAWAVEREYKFYSIPNRVLPNINRTLGDVLVKYSEEVAPKKKGARWDLLRLANIGKHPIACVRLQDLQRQHLDAWAQERLRVVKPSTINREFNLLSHCLTWARRWNWMTDNPMADLERPKNPRSRDRRISAEESEAILLSLSYREGDALVSQKQLVAVAFLFALETACRAGEICALKPEHINFSERTALLVETKNGYPRKVPLSKEAVRLLTALQPWGTTVFRLKSSALSNAFAKAVKEAGINDLVFHDSRHEAITRLAKRLPVLDLARMVGHRNINQLMTYYNKTAAELARQLD